MQETRRRFVMTIAAGSCFAAQDILLFGQTHRNGMPDPPPPAEHPGQDAAMLKKSAATANKRAILLQNERDFRAGVERLYELSGELRDEVRKTMTTDVLSVRMYKKTEEIEKLAKQLKSKAKG